MLFYVELFKSIYVIVWSFASLIRVTEDATDTVFKHKLYPFKQKTEWQRTGAVGCSSD